MKPDPATLPAAQARKMLERQGAPPLTSALRLLEEVQVERAVADKLWTVAGVGIAFSGMLHEAQATSGRRVIDTIFALHALLAPESAQPSAELAPSLFMHLEPYLPWLRSMARTHTDWRSLWMRWIDTLSERLTMHRYGDRGRRRLHARVLLAEPLMLIQAESGCMAGAQADADLIAFCETSLGFWDLIHAPADAAKGWNRIALPGENQMGGFFGLGDEARPPDEDDICRGAEGLLAGLLESCCTPLPLPGQAGADPLAAWIQRLQNELFKALELYLQTGLWPEWTQKPANQCRNGFLQRLKRIF